MRKNMGFFFFFASLKSLKKGVGSGSASKCHGSPTLIQNGVKLIVLRGHGHFGGVADPGMFINYHRSQIRIFPYRIQGQKDSRIPDPNPHKITEVF
jgi:hypothetical protein